ncbi:hypothetical protein, partial [Burkholderia metallica]|uniref:hypothetical protein n=1 Tax=Burkholderia metallica TaxID=488729 RepID=UPI00131E1AC3
MPVQSHRWQRHDEQGRVVDGLGNVLQHAYRTPAEAVVVNNAQLLTRGAPEMTVLVGGLRVLGANAGGA